MNDIPGLRLSPTRMIALLAQGARKSGPAPPQPSPTDRQAAGSSGRRALAARPLEVKARAITGADTTPAARARAARAPSSHPERMEDAYDVPGRDIGFGDFLDLINPLQHIPIVGTIYRAITGDEISPSASIFGGFLFGGPLGFVAAIANAIFEEASGQDLGETALAALLGDEAAPDVQTARRPSAGATAAPLDRIRIDRTHSAGSSDPVNPVYINKVEQIQAVDGIAEGDSNQPRSALGLATPTQDTQALAAATATGPPARQAGADPGASESLTGRAALDAFVRDLRETGQLARAEIPGAPAPRKAGGPQTAALPATRAAGRAAAHGSPSPALAKLPRMAQTRAGAASQEAPRNIRSWSEPGPGAGRDDPGAPLAIQARAPDARPLDPRTMAATLPAGAFAERMFHALDKYQATARAGERNGKARAPVLDAQL
jgi:hypothetical protein